MGRILNFPVIPVCDESTEYSAHIHPTYCSFYYECKNGTLSNNSCQIGQVFNKVNRSCMEEMKCFKDYISHLECKYTY